MSEHLWESVVELWLTRNRGFFVSPSYGLGPDGRWACLDFLALDTRSRHIWAVEVTSGADADKIVKKAKEFDQQYIPRIREAVAGAESDVSSLTADWPIGLWAFVRKDVEPNFRPKLAGYPFPVQINTLEEVTHPWSKGWWQGRFS